MPNALFNEWMAYNLIDPFTHRQERRVSMWEMVDAYIRSYFESWENQHWYAVRVVGRTNWLPEFIRERFDNLKQKRQKRIPTEVLEANFWAGWSIWGIGKQED